VVKNFQNKVLNHFPAEASIDVLGFRWILHAAKDHAGFLDLSLDAKPPPGYTGRYEFKTKTFVFFNIPLIVSINMEHIIFPALFPYGINLYRHTSIPLAHWQVFTTMRWASITMRTLSIRMLRK
jgi:hypothetical protein